MPSGMRTRWTIIAVWMAALILVGSTSPAQGQTAAQAKTANRSTSILDDPFVRKQGKRGVDLLYNMQFEEAQKVFDRIGRRYPEHPVGPFLKGLNIWWNHIMLDLEDPSHDDEFYAAMDRVIERCDRMLERDSDALDALFLKGAALGFRARLASNRSSWLQAIMDGKRAISYVRRAGERAPNDPDYIFGKGMYDYYAAILPEHYSAAKAVTLFLPDGSREEGLDVELDVVTTEDGPIVPVRAGVAAGIGDDGNPLLVIVALLDPPSGTILIWYLGFDADRVRPGDAISIGAFESPEDDDGLVAKDEFQLGTLPLDPDTDDGGERWARDAIARIAAASLAEQRRARRWGILIKLLVLLYLFALLFAALNVLDGTVIGQNMQRHRHQEFIRFLNEIERSVPAGKVIHVGSTTTPPISTRRSRPRRRAIRAGRSTSRRPRARG